MSHVRRASPALLIALIFTMLGCPLGRAGKELGEECYSANDCPMGASGLTCASGCVGPTCPVKSFCTRACKADVDCVSKVGAMVCTTGTCQFAPAK